MNTESQVEPVPTENTTPQSDPTPQPASPQGQKKTVPGRDPGSSSKTVPPAGADQATPAPESAAPTATQTKVARPAAKGRAAAPKPKPREVRHASLFLTHVDPWSVMKNAFMLTIALGIVMIVAVIVLWGMLSVAGVFDSLSSTITSLAPQYENVADLYSFSRVVGTTSIIAVLEVILLTALITVFAFLYNIAVGITGGIQVTLTDDK